MHTRMGLSPGTSNLRSSGNNNKVAALPWSFAGNAGYATKLLRWRKRGACDRDSRHEGRDVSVWTKEVKQRFSKWLNKRREAAATYRMEKFKSVLVQDGEALRTMALYIDLNPVRAGISGEPAEYRWSGYAAAAGGSKAEQAGLCEVMGREADEWKESAAVYRGWLFTAGVAVRGDDGKVLRRGVAAEESEAVMKAGGRMPLGQALGLRMRRMTDGLVLGSQAWVEEVYAAYREQFGRKRKVGARPLRGMDGGMCTLRG